MAKVKIIVEGKGKKVEKELELPDNVSGREKVKFSGKIVKVFWEAYKELFGE